MGKTSIEWATHTANWLAGCTRVSEACRNCYAEKLTPRLVRMGGPDRYKGTTEGGKWTGVVNYDAAAMASCFMGMRRAKNARRVFINSMSDTFHAYAPPRSLVGLTEQILRVEQSREDGKPWPHVIMLLTKRPGAMLNWQRRHFPHGLPSWVWVGVTVENQEAADERVPALLAVKAQGVRFLSCEPMVGPVLLMEHLSPRWDDGCNCAIGPREDETVLDANLTERCPQCNYALGGSPASAIHWVIVGGESGRNARPMHPDWARSLRADCSAAEVPFLFKQWGEWCPRGPTGFSPNYAPVDGPRVKLARCGHQVSTDTVMHGVPGYNFGCGCGPGTWLQRATKKVAGRLLDGLEYNAIPE